MTSDKSSSREQQDEPSLGLRFLRAAKAAMPRKLGKGVRSAALNDVMRVAIDCRMPFGRGEGQQLRHIDFSSCAGVFRALDERWYTHACRAGGTYATLWETYHRHKPWIAPDVFIGREVCDQARDSRVAPGMALLVPASGEEDADLPRFTANLEVWWCTSINLVADTITICRYRLPSDRRHVLTRNGQPKRRCVLDRVAWAELFPAQASSRRPSPNIGRQHDH